MTLQQPNPFGLFAATEARDQALAQVERNAGDGFTDRACAFVVQYLREHGEATGEAITDACKQAGIVPQNDDRAFGPVYFKLSKAGVIVKCGTAPRMKGHKCAGGNIWKLT